MKADASHKKVFPLLKSSIDTIIANPVVAFPYVINLFIQLLILEILFFSNRYPLKTFFGPITKTLWGENYIHYPLNLMIIPDFFQRLQIPLYIFVYSFFVAVSTYIIATLNNGKKVELGSIFREVFKSYLFIVIAAMITSLFVVSIFNLYGLVYNRAAVIRSTSGVFFMIKRIVMEGTPYFGLMGSVFVTTLFAYVMPAIVIDKRRIFAALAANFKLVGQSFFTILGVVFVPMFVFVIVLLLQNSLPRDLPLPEIRVWTLILSVVLMVMIDAVVYTAITTYYLISKENK